MRRVVSKARPSVAPSRRDWCRAACGAPQRYLKVDAQNILAQMCFGYYPNKSIPPLLERLSGLCVSGANDAVKKILTDQIQKNATVTSAITAVAIHPTTNIGPGSVSRPITRAFMAM